MVYFPKRLQVFVSSTYLDLIEERQAAVQAILEAKHIPAGMELFTAGDQSQWEVIKQWIDQSDIYLLILGGRYGSIDRQTGKSYTHLEYEYALEKSIPVFSCVLRDPDKRAIEKQNFAYVERDNPNQYKEFRQLVTANSIVKFWEDSREIEKEIIKALHDFEQRENIIGWVRGDKRVDLTIIKQENAKLRNSNQELIQKLEQEKENYDQKLQEIQSNTEKLATTLQERINQLKQELLTKNAKITQLQEQINNPSTVSTPTPETEKIELKSAKGVDYTQLRDLLAAEKWKEADQETSNVMLQAANRFSEAYLMVSDIDNFPCEDLCTIDQLWVKYSNGKFGFSVQKKIYIDELGGTREYNERIWQEFCDRVGWRKGGSYVNYSNLTFELQGTTPVGHLPSLRTRYGFILDNVVCALFSHAENCNL